MKNFIQPGKILEIAAPSGGVVSGKAYIIGSLFLIATVTALVGIIAAFGVEGVVELDVDAADTPAVGGKAYWDVADDNFTTDADTGTNKEVGIFTTVKTAANLVSVRLNGVGLA